MTATVVLVVIQVTHAVVERNQTPDNYIGAVVTSLPKIIVLVHSNNTAQVKRVSVTSSKLQYNAAMDIEILDGSITPQHYLSPSFGSAFVNTLLSHHS